MRNNQNYLPEILFNAYKNAIRQNDVVTIIMPSDTCDIEIESVGVDIDSAVQEVFSFLHIVDAMVQENNREYAVAGLTLHLGKVEILYYGVSENTEFDVLVFKENEQWYCSYIGLKLFDPPLPIEWDQAVYTSDKAASIYRKACGIEILAGISQLAGEPVRIFIDCYVDHIMTNAGKTYIIRFYMYHQNDANPDTVGISQITLTRDGGEELTVGELIREDGDETQIYNADSKAFIP